MWDTDFWERQVLADLQRIAAAGMTSSDPVLAYPSGEVCYPAEVVELVSHVPVSRAMSLAGHCAA